MTHKNTVSLVEQIKQKHYKLSSVIPSLSQHHNYVENYVVKQHVSNMMLEVTDDTKVKAARCTSLTIHINNPGSSELSIDGKGAAASHHVTWWARDLSIPLLTKV
ncbi:hypothetical protein C0Q70_20174 [Pomacea canaliculata]|uniref:Uncharacterized protein n=1 Tax=Pomacea canaliculata TaxID=400727 RepID=A0A2T7NEU2_POMCA|nr:hypothetical protein C0Q70_20174 [Pomacea canaliculata]